VRDILAADVSPAMLEALRQRCGPASTLGNEPGVRTWQGSVEALPAYQVRLRAAATAGCL
jgi:ubiquinone/menaquinone biosynthesis C-methylase UbiE